MNYVRLICHATIVASLAFIAITGWVEAQTVETHFQIIVQADGQTTVNGAVIPNAFQATPDEETILVRLIQEASRSVETVTIELLLPQSMPAGWQPRLIPARCACETILESQTDRSFFFSVRGVTTGARLSLRADFPAGTFTLSASAKTVVGLERWSPWFLGLAVLILIITFSFLIWLMRELHEVRKFRLNPTSLDHPPNDVTPAMISLIPSGKITAHTLAGMLLHLSQRGYLTMMNKKDTFLLAEDRHLDLSGPGFAIGSLPDESISRAEQVKAAQEGVTLAEKFLLAKLFTQDDPVVSREDLKIRFGRRLTSFKIGKLYAELYRQATADGYFIKNPHLIHLRYRALGVGIFFLGLLGLIGSLFFPSHKLILVLAWALVIVTGRIITKMVPYLPLLTVLGQAEWVRWAGFRAYLADPKPLPKTVPAKQFFIYLPYAMALGVGSTWADRFGTREAEAPSWFLTEPKIKPVDQIAKELEHLAAFVTELLAAIHEHTVR